VELWFTNNPEKHWMKCGRIEEVARSCLEDDPWSCSIRGRLARCNDLQWCNRLARVRNSFVVKTRWCKRFSPTQVITLRDARPELETQGNLLCVVSRTRGQVSSCLQCGLIDVVLTRIQPVISVNCILNSRRSFLE